MRRTKPILPIAVAGLLAVSPTLFAGPIPAGVAEDALWFAQADLRVLRETALGQHVLEALHEGAADDRLAALSAVLNFDPRSDLDVLQVYGRGQDGDGVAILRGEFDGERLMTLVRAAEGYRSEEYGAHRLHSWIDRKKGAEKRTVGCVYDDNTVVFADSLDVLRRAVDVLDGRAPALARAGQFPSLYDTGRGNFLLAAADIAALEEMKPRAEVFKVLSSAVLSVSEADGNVCARIVMETASHDAAANIKKILDGMAALALLAPENDPAAARLAAASDSVQDGRRLIVTLRSPVEDVIAHMEKNLCPAE